MAGTLIGCGGTGAHVALAFMRLHALGTPLGFFRNGNDALELPSLYLVDQDSGDGLSPDRPTAWQALRRVRELHPARPRRDESPELQVVTPLPVGAREDFLADGMTSLARHYPHSDYLDCILSPNQRDIDFSRGMMGSPAVGALLFELKSHDTRPGHPDINHDKVYHRLLGVKGRVAIAGSGVGGTGAAIGPTLAEELSGADERHVMAVMLLNWFEFSELDPNLGERLLKAQHRNRVLRENAHTGLRYYGNRLAQHAATVPVGIPRAAMVPRNFSGDNHQPMLEAYPHAVAAICCLGQFLSADAYSNGLYHLGAEDPSRLTLGTGLPGGGTIRDLVLRSKILVDTLGVYRRVLGSPPSEGGLESNLCTLLGDHRRKAAGEIGRILEGYSENLHWLGEMLGHEKPEPIRGSSDFLKEASIRRQLERHPLKTARLDYSDQAAFEVFEWLAAWIREKIPTSTPASSNGVYWPEMYGDQGLAPAAKESGALQKVPKANVEATLDSFVDRALLAQNGWPHPLAAADYFREAIATGHPKALRQLELLFLGLIRGELELRNNEPKDNRPVSLDNLVEGHRNGDGSELARYALIDQKGMAMGFTAPKTLFCPAPGLPDESWANLWATLTGEKSAKWCHSGHTWGHGTSSAGRIRAWIDACERRYSHAPPPPWTRIFEDVPARDGYGGGATLKVLWSDNALIDVFLPTRHENESRLPPDLPTIDPEDFLSTHAEITEDGERKYWRVEFEIADEGKVHGIWHEHLRHLQKTGNIAFFCDDATSKQVFLVIWSVENGHRLVTLSNTMVLRHGDIGIRRCAPMEQELVPTSDVSRDVLYPHYPVHWRYFDLLMPHALSGDDSVLDTLKQRNVTVHLPPQPQVSEDQKTATWSLRLRGRSDIVPLAVSLESTPLHKAHWMVWPRFRATDWRAYYVYQHCTHRRIQISALWLNNRDSGVSLSRTVAKDRLSYPVRFLKGDARHDGGPPVALSAADGDDQIGLYLVPLDRVPRAALRMQVGIDFGTSHSTASIKLGDRSPQSVELSPELAPDSPNRLSLHVSENMEHVEADDKNDGLLSKGKWFPRYVKHVREDLKGLWPSDLLTIKQVDTLKTQSNISHWEPLRDYVIPPVALLRHDLEHHVIANFKWNTSRDFQGKESQLRKIYLDRIVEQVMAEAFIRHGRPAGTDVRFTFTYPLRTPPSDVGEYQRTLKSVLDDGTRSLGCELVLHNQIGLFDESHAVKVGTDQSGDVNVVGDLGGGTLDLIISAVGARFEDTADSVRLGGNVLLGLIADTRRKLLPGWIGDRDARLTKLAALARTKSGLAALSTLDADIGEGFSKLGVPDDRNLEIQNIARRYFFLVGEFMGRSLAAYLAGHWLPNVTDRERERLRIRVYLRGNGWKLWPEPKSYNGIGRVVQRRMTDTLGRLWPTLGDNAPTLPAESMWKTDHQETDQAALAKAGVVKNVAGRSEDPDNIRDHWFSHTLAELTSVDREGNRKTVEWFERVPFRTGGEGMRIEFEEIRPGLPLASPHAIRPEVVTTLPVDLTQRINENLRDQGEWRGDDGLDYQAPSAAWIWEAVAKRNVAHPADK